MWLVPTNKTKDLLEIKVYTSPEKESGRRRSATHFGRYSRSAVHHRNDLTVTAVQQGTHRLSRCRLDRTKRQNNKVMKASSCNEYVYGLAFCIFAAEVQFPEKRSLMKTRRSLSANGSWMSVQSWPKNFDHTRPGNRKYF